MTLQLTIHGMQRNHQRKGPLPLDPLQPRLGITTYQRRLQELGSHPHPTVWLLQRNLSILLCKPKEPPDRNRKSPPPYLFPLWWRSMKESKFRSLWKVLLRACPHHPSLILLQVIRKASNEITPYFPPN